MRLGFVGMIASTLSKMVGYLQYSLDYTYYFLHGILLSWIDGNQPLR